MKFGYNNINNVIKGSALMEFEGHEDPVQRVAETEDSDASDVTDSDLIHASDSDDLIHDYTSVGILIGVILLSYIFI